ncbi:MAG TPA: GerMN domain-containing protein [Symbiobacteriaceae bacterium]|nr:GerMN domain-containing protein [Symbiobacteriaceae bacterium]
MLGVGYWAKNYRPEPAPTQDKTTVSAPKAEATKPAAQNPAPVNNPQPKPPAQTTPPADPTKDLLDKRAQIDRSAGAAKTMLVTIYYADALKTVDTLQPVEVRIEQTTSQIKRTAELVVAAPEDLKLYSGVPAGTKVLSADYNSKTGVATVDLSPELTKAQAGDVAKIKASFVYSLAKVPGVKSVQLWVQGRPAMLHQQEWSKPLSPADLDAQNLFKVEPLIKFKQ